MREDRYEDRSHDPFNVVERVASSGRRISDRWKNWSGDLSREQLSRIAKILAGISFIVMIANIIIYINKF